MEQGVSQTWVGDGVLPITAEGLLGSHFPRLCFLDHNLRNVTPAYSLGSVARERAEAWCQCTRRLSPETAAVTRKGVTASFAVSTHSSELQHQDQAPGD